MTNTMCVTCGARTHQPDADEWGRARLDQPLEIRSTIDADAPPFIAPAGYFRTCPDCTSWIPNARSAPLPAGLRHLVDTQADLFATLIDDESIRHQIIAQQVGIYRHLATHLEPS